MRASKGLSYVLLLSLLLHLGDWPYVDEIMGQPGPVSQLIGSAQPSDDGGSSEQSDNAAGKSGVGYQLLLSLQGVPAEPLRLPAPISHKADAHSVKSFISLIPPRIDRPPVRSSLS